MMTIEEIKENLAFAAKVMRCLPKTGPHGYISSWPAILCQPGEAEVQPDGKNTYQPTAQDVSRMEEILDWFKPLNALETKLVWRRANKVSWKMISAELGYHRSKLDEKYRIALVKIQAVAT